MQTDFDEIVCTVFATHVGCIVAPLPSTALQLTFILLHEFHRDICGALATGVIRNR
jgi:hypothetical protein